MQLFTIATKTSIVAGHGDNRTEEHICRLSTGEFPPMFFSRSGALAWIDATDEYGPFVPVAVDFPSPQAKKTELSGISG